MKIQKKKLGVGGWGGVGLGGFNSSLGGSGWM